MLLPDENELEQFKISIKKARAILPSSLELVKKTISDNPEIKICIEKEQVSKAIKLLRQISYDCYLKLETPFNNELIQLLPEKFGTPKKVLDDLITEDIVHLNTQELKHKIKKICGHYSSSIYPFIYTLNLSTTNSRRARSGQTFEAAIYSIYNFLNYPFDSQKKAGASQFKKLNLGKKVDSLLPSVDAYSQRRDKVIVGTMKTSLRERWQEVAEEIKRTNVPSIYLLTADEEIAKNKAEEIAQHNINLVVYNDVKKSLSQFKNIISFESYFYQEIPAILKYWNEH